MKAFKFYIFRISLAVIFGLLPMTVWAGDKLTHYEGIANKKGDYNWNGTQKCHELIYYYYVTKGQKELELTLPFATVSLTWNQEVTIVGMIGRLI